MRLALLSDIHGNLIALDAVLADIAAQGGVDGYWVLGDLAAIGYAPAATIERLHSLPGVLFTRGNTDRYVTTGDRPPPTPADVARDPGLLAQYTEVTNGFAWTQGYLAATGWFDWLTALPLEARLTLPDGTRLLGVHASPGRDDGDGIHPGLSDDEQDAMLIAAEADLICVGHTHVPVDRNVARGRAVNLGSVSNPVTADLRASYALLEADPSGYHLHHRQVDYDREAVITAIERSGHPSQGHILKLIRGQIRSELVEVDGHARLALRL
jgi:predicted phosphodiesterase